MKLVGRRTDHLMHQNITSSVKSGDASVETRACVSANESGTLAFINHFPADQEQGEGRCILKHSD